MAFALATGRWIASLAASDLLTQSGFGTVQTAQDHPGWLMACDAMSQISQKTPDPGQGRYWRVVLEGYLANGVELAATLERPPADPQRHPACLIAALLDERGPDALERLSGNFSLAAGHVESGAVIARRDRLGGRTLYYSHRPGSVLLSTRSAWIVHLENRTFRPDPDFLASFFGLQSAPPPGHSAFTDLPELMPGEQLRIDGERLQRDRKTLDFSTDFNYDHPGECIERFGDLVRQAVETVLPPDGNVACMLSGGLDSVPAALFAEQALSRAGRELVLTSWQLPEFPKADESAWIRMAAEQLHSQPDLFDGSAMLPFGHLDTRLSSPDIPYYNAFRPLVDACYQRAAAAGCRVVINANAGDDLYPPIKLINLDRLKRHQWKPVWDDLVRLWRQGRLRALSGAPQWRYLLRRLVKPWASGPPKWLARDGRKHWRAVAHWPRECAQAAFPEYAWQLLGSRMAFGRAHENDRPNQFGVDRRDPFHNEALARFMLNAPFDYSYRKGVPKWIMRVAMREHLPEPLRRKRRTGLLDSFFEAGLEANVASVHRLLFSQQTEWQGYIEPAVIERLLAERSGAPLPLVSACVGHALWVGRWQDGG